MIVAVLGQALLLLVLIACVAGAAASFVSGRRVVAAGDPPATPRGEGEATAGALDATWPALALGAGRLAFAGAVAAMFVLLLALYAPDYTLAYVAERTSRDLGPGYRLTALWSGQEGSLLLWLVTLTGLGALMVRSLRRAGAPAGMLLHANGVVLAVASFFALLVAAVARPFAVADTLAGDGTGMSPALQNPWMAIHPPALYLGYVGITIPFAIVAGAMLARRSDDAWVTLTRRWALLAWLGLSAGLLLGARWAYEEIGWGGWWGWDPVENAALMPWIVMTAFIHSVSVQQQRGMMRFWNAVLVTLAFGLSIFGTFLTRSGVLSSVHSFVSSPVGWWFMGFLTLVVVASLVLLLRSRGLLQARHDVESVASREALLLFNNLLLVAFALTVLWGVLFPILTASLTDTRLSLQQPWYEFFARALGLPIVMLLVFAPAVGWRRSSWRATLRTVAAPLLVGVAASVAVMATIGAPGPAALAAVGFGVAVIIGIALELQRGARNARTARPGTGWARGAAQTVAARPRRWGGWIAHAGIGLLVIAIAGGSWGTSQRSTLREGERMRVGGWVLELDGSERRRDGSSMQTRASFRVLRDGRQVGRLSAGRNFYPASGEISNEVAIRHDLRRVQDLFVVVDRIAEDGEVSVEAFVNPLLPLVWIAGIVTMVGAAIALLGSRKERRPTVLQTLRTTPGAAAGDHDLLTAGRPPGGPGGSLDGRPGRVPGTPIRVPVGDPG